MRGGTLFGLIICNLVWSVNPVMSKYLMEDFSAVEVAWFRYLSAWLILAGAGLILPKWIGLRGDSGYFCWPESKGDRILIVLLGLLTFCFSPLTQMIGLKSSLATESALIVAMEPVVTALMAWILLKEWVSRADLLTFILAFSGFLFLAGSSSPSPDMSETDHFMGNGLIMISLLGEAVFAVISRKLAVKYSPVSMMGAALTIGVGVMGAILFFSGSIGIWPHHGFQWRHLFPLFWIGPLATAGGYLFTMIALEEASVVHVSLLLFLQPVFGALAGYFLLQDRLSSLQILGGGLILVGVLLSNAQHLRKLSILRDST